MEYRGLGRSGLKVSPLCLGTMLFGGRTDEATALRMVDRAHDAGINFIDSADQYVGGKSEEITGRAIVAAACIVGAFMEALVGPLAPARGTGSRADRHLVEQITQFCLRASVATTYTKP